MDQTPELLDIYQALKRNAGREHVTDGNVAALISMAQERGDSQLEYLLREWRSSCGDDGQAPPLEDVQGLPPPQGNETAEGAPPPRSAQPR